MKSYSFIFMSVFSRIKRNLEYLLDPKALLFGLTLASSSLVGQTTTSVQGHVRDKDFPGFSIDSAYVKGVDLGSSELRFDTYSDGNGFYSAVVMTSAVQDETFVPSKFGLGQNFPNPFNPGTKFEVSVSKPGSYRVEFFDVTGAELFKQDYDLGSGSYIFSVSGLGAGGVKFYRIIGEGVNEVRKMVQLDGSDFNPSVSVSSGGSSRLSKSMNLEMRISVEKQGYFRDSVDVSYVLGSSNVQDFSLSQVPKVDTIWVFSDLGLLPTGTPADNATIRANGNIIGVTNSQGQDTSFVLVEYVTNPLDSTDKKYTPGLISLLASRNNANNVTEDFVVDGSDIVWVNDLEQIPFLKTYNYSIFVLDSSTGLGVSGANVTGKKTSNDSLMVSKTTDSQGYANGADDYLGYENDANGVFNFVGNMTWTATKNMFNSNYTITSFSSNIADTVAISPVPPPVRSWEWRVMDPLDNPLNPTLFVKNVEGEVFTFNPQTNGIYNVSVPTYGNSVKVWWSHPDLQEIGYIMPPNKQGQDKNIAQNERVAPGSLDTLTVSDISVLEQYQFTKLKMLHNFVDGRDMLSNEAKRIIVGRRGYNTTRFMEEPSLNMPRLDIVIYGKYENGLLLSAFDSTRIVNITTNITGLIKNLDYQIHYITDWSEQIWQDILARGGDNALMYRFKQDNPANLINYKFASNGLIRNKYGSGWGNQGNSDMTWAAEIMQPMFSLDDPDEVQNLGPWIYVNGVGPTQFARYIAAYISEADNQKYWYISGNKSEKEFIEDPFTSTPTWGNVNYYYKED